jgi:hypothetical protein
MMRLSSLLFLFFLSAGGSFVRPKCSGWGVFTQCKYGWGALYLWMVFILFPLLPAVIFHLLYSRLGSCLRGADALLFHGGVGFAVCLKAYPDTKPPLPGSQDQSQKAESASRSRATDRSVRFTGGGDRRKSTAGSSTPPSPSASLRVRLRSE